MNDPISSDRAQRARRGRATVLPSAPASAAAPGSALETLEQIAFGEVWQQPGLNSRERRLITLACLGIVGTERTVGLHIRGALDSGDLSPADLDAFTLHFGVYAGFPRASAFGSALGRALDEIAAAGDPEGPR